jgi:hypothetical protein
VPRLNTAVVESRLQEWRQLLRGSVTQTRTVLQEVLAARLVCTPHVSAVSGAIDGYEFSTQTKYHELFTGLATSRPKGLDPHDVRGTEAITDEDTLDQDYGKVLERAYAKVVASPTGNNGFCLPEIRRSLRDAAQNRIGGSALA